MAKETECSQGWSLCLIGSGILAILIELTLFILVLEQIFSHTPMSLHQATNLLGLFASLVVVPIPWLGIRMGIKRFRVVMRGLDTDEKAMSSLDATMGNILILSYVAIIGCVIALARLT
ncbi:MAG: hypothetical protein WAN35_16795 [Terracidiphilus sp.]